jgi:hypothetical protein
VAAIIGDNEYAERYLNQYENRIMGEREYPYHTGEAGWIVKTCTKLKENYKQKQETGLLKAWIDKLEGCYHER